MRHRASRVAVPERPRSTPTVPDEPAEHVRVLQLAETDRLADDEVAVMVDVLRASSTIAIAFDRGAASVHPVQTPDDARRRAQGLEDAVLVGERNRGELEGFIDNSPARLEDEDLTGRHVVLTTTNGTRALLACEDAGRVLVGGLVNASALADELSGERVALVAAGWEDQPASDDDACCAYLAELFRGGRPRLGETLEALEASTSAVKLREHGKGADVDICLSLDVAPVVPEMDGDRLVV